MREKKKLTDIKIQLTLDIYDLAWMASLAVLFVVMLEMFYRMIVNYNGRYETDVKYYVTDIAQTGEEVHRLMGFMFKAFYNINRGTLEANVYLAAVIVLIVIVSYFVIRYFVESDGYIDTVPRRSMQFMALAMLFIGPIYMPVLHEYFYIKSFYSFAWHSPTQQSMTLFAMISAVCFIEMYMTYEKKGIRPRLWTATMVSTLIATGFKPSYTIDLALAIVVMFVIDLIKDRREGFAKRFGQMFIMGCSIVPSGLYMIWLYFKEFAESTQLDEEHEILLSIAPLLEYKGLWAAVLFGITFPIVVFVFNSSRFKDVKYRVILYIFITGVLQWAFIEETGTRANYGNFTWGRMIGCWFLTLAACPVFLETRYDKDMLGRNSEKRKAFITLTSAVLILAICSQAYYLWLVVTGRGWYH